jgi:flavin-dependent dehydrogenase
MYDAIIVGTRCAGSPTAMLLARKGYKVLAVDKASFPSNTISTHYLHLPAIVRLKRWNLLDRVQALDCPPVTKAMIDFDGLLLAGQPPALEGITEEYCIRRTILDKLLVDAAVESGVELRENFTVEEVLMEDDRVVGIRGHDKNGAVVTEKARIVIGADGINSIVANTVKAPKYNEKPILTCGYYSYWSNLPLSDGSENYYRNGQVCIVVLPTNNNLTLVFCIWPYEKFATYKQDIERYYMETLELAPAFAERVRQAKREEKIYGTGNIPNYFRKPFGDGWALIGDSGYHKDSITAEGISDAFRDAELLTDAIDDGFSERRPLAEALADYEQQRNISSMPLYEFTCQFASLSLPPDVLGLIHAMKGNQPQIDKFMGIIAGSVSAAEFFAPENLQQIMIAAQMAQSSN